MSKKPSELLKCPPRATRLQYKIYQNLLDSNSSVCGFDSSAWHTVLSDPSVIFVHSLIPCLVHIYPCILYNYKVVDVARQWPKIGFGTIGDVSIQTATNQRFCTHKQPVTTLYSPHYPKKHAPIVDEFQQMMSGAEYLLGPWAGPFHAWCTVTYASCQQSAMANDGKTVRLCITVSGIAKLGMHYHSFIACQCILVLVKGLSDNWGIYCVGRDQRMIAPSSIRDASS